MSKFEPGGTYSVLHMHDHPERVTVASRTPTHVTLSDGRCARVLIGEAPDGGDDGKCPSRIGPEDYQ